MNSPTSEEPHSSTMAEIAEASGVSRSTVSRALRNDPRISPKTREKVQQAAQQLAYRPNALISTLMADLRVRKRPASTSTIAYVSNYSKKDLDWRYFEDFYDGVLRRAEELGYHVEHFPLAETGISPDRLSRILYARNIQGVLIAPTSNPQTWALDWEKFAPATICYSLREPHLSLATNHHYHSMLLAFRHLRELGYRRIGFGTRKGVSRLILDVWLGAYLAAQVTLPPEDRVEPFIGEDATPAKIGKWMRAQRPDAVIGSHFGILILLAQAGFRVPEDTAMAFLNLNDTVGRSFLTPSDPQSDSPYAGIFEHYAEVGAATVDLIIGQLHRNERGLPKHPKLILIQGTWQDGDTAPPAGPALPFPLA